MTASGLRHCAELAAREILEACSASTKNGPCDKCIADAIEAEAKRFAEKALRGIYEVDDHDQWSSDGERARGGFRVKTEYAGRPGVEWRHYREDFSALIAAAIAEAEKCT